MTRLISYISWIFLFLLCHEVRAQAPPNDNCENALEIIIPNAGFAFDTISSAKTNVSKATRQLGEHCAEELEENGNCVKTVWYKFYLPTTRNVGIQLTQEDSAIPQIFSGFNIYKINGCSYTLSDFANQLTPLNKFGTSGNACLTQGWYMVQIGCKQKAKGDIWLDLEIGKPYAETYDHIAGIFQLYRNVYKQFSMECASVDEVEAAQLADSSFSKSIWFTVFVEPNSEESSLNIYGSQTIKYRIFYDNIHPDSIYSNKPFQSFLQGGTIISELCPGFNTARKYYIQLVVSSEARELSVSFYSGKFNVDPWNTPNTNEVMTLIPNTRQSSLKHFHNCESLLANHACKNVIPKAFIKKHRDRYNYNQFVTDTFGRAGYMIINVPEDGLLFIQNRIGNEEFFYFALYEGDIRNTCQLKLLADSTTNRYTSMTHCIQKGTYTLVIASTKFGTYSSLDLQLEVSPLLPLYTYPSAPEKLPDYKPSDRGSIDSEISSFRVQDTSITISNITFRGGFIYREIFISEGGDIDIGIPNNRVADNGYLHIFRGQISNGTAAAIPTLDYSRYYRNTADMAEYSGGHEKCFYMSKGYYTILVWNGFRPQYDKLLPCQVKNNQIYIRPIPICPSYNNIEPQFAIPINHGKDVFDTIGPNFTYNYSYGLLSCNFCASRSIFTPAVSCKDKYNLTPYSTYHYYTFYLGENASMYIATSGYELYQGNVLTNPGVVKDSNNIIDPCNNGRMICNLQGKKYYTLIIFNQQNSMYGYYLNFTKHRASPNDFADHSFDLGDVSGDTILSAYSPITCHTNGFVSDPSPALSPNAPGTTSAIPFPDTLNHKKTKLNKQNLWYTFTCAGSSNISIKLKNFPSYYYNGQDYYCYVLKYKGTFHKDFKDVLADNFDSTLLGMEPVLYEAINNSNPYIKFTNTSCKDNRYFVLVYHAVGSNNSYEMSYVNDFAIEVSGNSESHPINGDQCNSGVTGQYNKAGKYKLKADNACHTYGQSIFEEDVNPNIKSTWFAIQVEKLDKFDLKVRNINGKGLLRYHVYGGTCKAMTRIAKQGDRYAYFTLSCMGQGIYYIQAICDAKISEELNFEVTIIDASKAPCKPYDFKYPIAQFDFRGGCHTNDSIIFRNLSTKGDDMDYTWYLNDKIFSTETNPLLFRNSPGILPVNNFKLIVLNTAENIRDTFLLDYKKDTSIYTFRIDGQPFYLCRDTLRLALNTNYQGRLNYAWYTYPNNILGRKPQYSQNYMTETKFYLDGESDNCHFKDSFSVIVKRSLNRFRDSAVCSWNPYVMKNTDSNYGLYMYWLNNGTYENVNLQPGESYTIQKSGLYMVYYYDKQCGYLDSMNISIEQGPRILSQSENIYACNVMSKNLTYIRTKDSLYHLKWNTGDTLAAITANKSGQYKLSGDFSKCRSLSYTASLTLEKLNTNLLRDTTVCKFDDLPFKNPYGSNFKILYKEPNKDTLHMTGPIQQVLKVQRSACLVQDSAVVTIFPFAGRRIDSFYCDEKLTFSMFLNAGEARAYNWYQQQENQRQLLIHNYGNYPVARLDTFGCKDTLDFHVITNCEFTVFVPNAFSPNDDNTNESFGPVISGRYQKFEMVLFNHWGEIVFETDKILFWDGKYKGEYRQGVYGYLITVYDEYNRPFRFKGTVTLLY